jgi:hypothetical protein
MWSCGWTFQTFVKKRKKNVHKKKTLVVSQTQRTKKTIVNHL